MLKGGWRLRGRGGVALKGKEMALNGGGIEGGRWF